MTVTAPELISEDATETIQEPVANVSAPEEVREIAATQIIELHPNLIPICACESRGRADAKPTHYEADGVTVLRGRINNLDVGMCQINLKYHEATAIELGLDLFVEEDNITYANYLYEHQGARPWSWSAHCHGQY